MKVNNKLFGFALTLMFTMIILLLSSLSTLQATVEQIYVKCIDYFGCFFVFTNICCLIFSIWIMFGKYKDVVLGGDDSRPEFSTISWAGMMFTTSCGAWLIVYGFLEPIYCISQDAINISNASAKAYEYGQMYAHFHWGPNAWSIYVPVTIAIGYSLYNRKEKATTLSSAIHYILKRNRLKNILSIAVDIIAICGTVIAPVISIGTGLPLLVRLVKELFDVSSISNDQIQIVILLIWISIFGCSVFLGLHKGIKKLSNINISVAFLYMLSYGILVGLIDVFASEINNVGNLISNYIRLSTYTDPYGSGSFVKGWTFSYWACYFVYMPLMGVFNAKISKGRKLKEIAMGQLVLCSLGCWVAMSTFGNYAIKIQDSGIADLISYLSNGDEPGAIIALLLQTPFPKLFMALLLCICFIFLATTMDSSAFVAAEMTVVRNGEFASAPRWIRMTWAVIASILALVLIKVGGAKAVRSLCYIAGLPLAVLTYFIFISVFKMLKDDYGGIKWWSN